MRPGLKAIRDNLKSFAKSKLGNITGEFAENGMKNAVRQKYKNDEIDPIEVVKTATKNTITGKA